MGEIRDWRRNINPYISDMSELQNEKPVREGVKIKLFTDMSVKRGLVNLSW